MRTITELAKRKEQVTVFLPTEAAYQLFLRQAEEEGFTVGKNGKPTESVYNDLIRLHPDKTIGHEGFIGHLAFRLKEAKTAVPTIWVDYEQYRTGGRYVIKRSGPGVRNRIRSLLF